MYILLGAIILSLGVTLFFIPNHIAAGGTPGIATLINHVADFPIGVIMFCINVPLVLLSIKFIGKTFAFKTIFAICISSFSVDFIREVLMIEAFTHEPILGSIFGGILIGFGLGFIIEGNASAGGPSIIAKIIALKMNKRQENVIIILDALIVISAGFVFNNIESTLWSLVGVYASFKSIDVIVTGRQIDKSVHISSSNIEELSSQIYNSFGKEGIIIKGVSSNFNQERKILMLVIPNNRIVELQEIVYRFDKESMIVVNDVSEMLVKNI